VNLEVHRVALEVQLLEVRHQEAATNAAGQLNLIQGPYGVEGFDVAVHPQLSNTGEGRPRHCDHL
jgi:hypothetical protein